MTNQPPADQQSTRPVLPRLEKSSDLYRILEQIAKRIIDKLLEQKEEKPS